MLRYLLKLWHPNLNCEGSHVNKPSIKSYGVKRVFFLYTLCLIVLMLVLSFALISESERSLTNFTFLYAQKNSELLQTAIHQATSQIDSAFTLLQYDSAFSKIMQATSYSQISPQIIRDFTNLISSKANIPSGATVSISTDLVSYSNIYLKNELEHLDSLMPATRSATSLGIQNPASPIVEKEHLTFGYNYYVHGEKIGNVYISLNAASLAASLPIAQQEGVYFVLADDQKKTVLLHTTDSSPEMSEKLAQLIAGENELTPLFFFLRHNRYALQSAELEGIHCTIYSIIDTTVVTAPLKNMYLFSLSILLLLLGISLIGNTTIHRSIVRPLSNFSRYITELRTKQNILLQPTPPLVASGCSEIQDIEREFTALIESISTLSAELQQKNEDLHQAELLRKNIEIEQLRSQINPHFLYNTLELIRADAIAGRIDQVSSITASMGKFYRYSIKGAPMATLQEELEHVRAYLNIQQERFDGRITVLYNISAETNGVLIPKMILQPLVENAIIHGLEPSGGAGTLFVGAMRSGDMLILSVRDDGIGIAPERLNQLQQQLESLHSRSDCVGIANVSARLHLQYGDRCRFLISSTPNDGTCICLHIPVT